MSSGFLNREKCLFNIFIKKKSLWFKIFNSSYPSSVPYSFLSDLVNNKINLYSILNHNYSKINHNEKEKDLKRGTRYFSLNNMSLGLSIKTNGYSRFVSMNEHRRISSMGHLLNIASKFSKLSFSTFENKNEPEQKEKMKPSMDNETKSYSSLASNSFFKPMIIFIITSIGLLAYFKYEKKRMEETKMELIQKSKGFIGEAKIGGSFSLLNQFKQSITDKDFLGKFVLYYFGFTHCPDICPDELEKMTNVITNLDNDPTALTKDKLIPVFVTVDPKRDGPEQLATYLGEFHKKIIGLTGSSEQMLSFAKSFRVYCSKNIQTEGSTNENDYLVDHSVFFYLMGPDGKFVDFFGKEMTEEEMTFKISEYIKQAIDIGKLSLK